MPAVRHITAQLLLRLAIAVAPPAMAAQLAPALRPIWRPRSQE
jgi:hypothetical protein